jgi:hypothetical protein
VREVAEGISPRLAKAALAAVVDGRLVDLSHLLTQDAAVRIVTTDSPEALTLYRHSTAHLLAAAVTNLFPTVQCGMLDLRALDALAHPDEIPNEAHVAERNARLRHAERPGVHAKQHDLFRGLPPALEVGFVRRARVVERVIDVGDGRAKAEAIHLTRKVAADLGERRQG